MVSWDFAEKTIDATSSACRESLQNALEKPNATLSPACRAEVGKLLDHHPPAGESKPRKGGSNSGGQNDSRGSKHEKTKADGTITIVLAFVACVLVAVVALAYFVGGGRTIGGRQMRGGRRLHKKRQDRIRDRGKKRR